MIQKTLLISLIVIFLFSFKQSYSQADAGPDQEICADHTFMEAIDPAPNTGHWIVLSGLGTFETPTLYNTLVSGLNPGLNFFRWEVTIGVDVFFDDIIITNNEVTASAGPYQFVCSDVVHLTATDPLSVFPYQGSGLWSSSGDVVFSNASSFICSAVCTSSFNQFIWTVTNGICTDSDYVFTDKEGPMIDAGQDVITIDSTIQLNGSITTTGPIIIDEPTESIWNTIAGSGVIDSQTTYSANVSCGIGVNTFNWTVTINDCLYSDEVSITRVDFSCGQNQVIYNDIVTLDAADPFPLTGTWKLISGSGEITNSTLCNTTVTGLGSGDNVFSWMVCGLTFPPNIFNWPPGCESELVTITRNLLVANAGQDISLPNYTNGTKLNAYLQPGTSGMWSVIQGDVVVENPLDPNSMVSNLSSDDNILRWTISHAKNSEYDDITITVLTEPVYAGPDQELCTDTAYTEAANPLPYEGLWSIINSAGTPVIENPTLFNSKVTDLASGTNILKWTVNIEGDEFWDLVTISNNAFSTSAGPDQSLCSDYTEFQISENHYWTYLSGCGSITENTTTNVWEVDLCQGENELELTVTADGCSDSDTILISNSLPSEANAGEDQTVCESTAILSGNNPIIGTGEWSRLGGAGVIADPSSYNTLVTGLSSGGNTFRWSITEGLCESYDDVLITNELVFASAGMDDYICGDTYNPLNGNQPGIGESGIWTVTGGTGVFDNPTLYNTGVTGLSGDENVLTWTVTRGLCSNSDHVSIFDMSPSPASVSNDQEICDDFAVISGNPPTIGVGEWSVAAGSGTFDCNSCSTTTVRDIGPDINIYRWTISNGTCSSSADITITNMSLAAVVGDSLFVCGPDAILSSGMPGAGETGYWTVTAGTGIITTNTITHVTTVSNMNVGINKFRWTISNSICSSYADLVATNNLYPASAVAGQNEICVDSTFILGTPPIQGCTGYWEVFAGAGVFENPTSSITNVYNINLGENVFRWFITKDGCTNYADAVVTNNMVNAIAGADIITCIETDTMFFPFEENISWDYLSGCGSITENNTSNMWEIKVCHGENVLLQTITNGFCEDSDTLIISDNSFVIEAGLSQTVCSTVATLSGQNPTPGTGIWTTGSGVTINNPSSYVTTVTGIQDNTVNVFRWTVIKNGCSAWDEVIITNNLVDANAGPDQSVCYANTVLNADNPVTGSGLWSITSGSGTITSPTYYATTVTGLNPGTTTLTWTVTNENCTDADNIVITNNMVTATAGEDQEFCDDYTYLSGDQPQAGGYGIWETAGGPGIVLTPSAYNTLVTNLQRGANTFRWTVYENGCTNGGDLVQVINNSFDANAGLDQIIVVDYVTLGSAGYGVWSLFSGCGTIVENSTENTVMATDLCEGENIFVLTVTNLYCTDSDEVSITYNPLGVEDLNSNFNVYPNPTNGLITITSTTEMSDAVLELKNIAGQDVQYKLIVQTSHSYGIDLSNLARGMYFLKINLNGETKMLRLLKK